MAGLWLYLRRRKDGVDGDAVAVPYGADGKSIFIVFAVVSAVEAGLFWLIDFGLVVDLLLLALGVYSALLVFGVYAGTVVRPHVISSREVRVRYSSFYDVRIPRENIAGLRQVKESHDPLKAKPFRDETWLSHDNFYETNLVVELREPITVTRPLGKTETVRVVKFQADDPKAAVDAYERLGVS
ncbi:integral membrane protein [Amycolatopsis decaplanina DSM 44594]|uniref:Integral membrane protein n=2 Tax=Amycolatopsis decaplanina TaxID=208441 RepID=M2YSR0_9PSEU|nr:integral membrane protein [Amycolatopsis decaplanina DSM 44594]